MEENYTLFWLLHDMFGCHGKGEPTLTVTNHKDSHTYCRQSLKVTIKIVFIVRGVNDNILWLHIQHW